MIKKLLLVLSMLVLAVALAGCGGLPKSAVAEVDGKVITREDLDKAVEELKAQYGDSLPASDSPEYAELQKQVAERLVNEEILWFEADKMNLTVTDEEINQQVDQYKEQSGGEDAFNQKLEENSLTLDRLKDQIRKSLLFQKIYPEVTKDAAPVTDEQALKYYTENPTQFQQPEMKTVSHILVADEATANAVKSRLDAGEDFATVAKEVSTDPGSKEKGGDLGEVPAQGSGFVPEFEAAMNTLAAGQVSAPVKSSFGYHIIKVTAVKPAGTQTFEEVKEELKQGLAMENQRTAFEAWFESVQGDYEVIYAAEFEPTPTNTTPTTATTATQAAPATP
ncbi:MAG: peptidyl-prolyl cis-trans isomerase [Actinobacteria bacterium]|nr:peptidyl-prolyl cis-trans isomerase [Actinomycetota bacterium]